jgi:hypothetical protein
MSCCVMLVDCSMFFFFLLTFCFCITIMNYEDSWLGWNNSYKNHGRHRTKMKRRSTPCSSSTNTATSTVPATEYGHTETALSVDIKSCYNCLTTKSPLWRKDESHRPLCNACGLYYKMHGSHRRVPGTVSITDKSDSEDPFGEESMEQAADEERRRTRGKRKRPV